MSLGDFDIRNNTLLVVLFNAVLVDEGRNWILYHCNAWQGLGKRMRRYVTGVLITPWMIMKTFQFCESRWHSDTGKENQGSLHVGRKDETEICAQSQWWQIISSQFCCCQLKSGRALDANEAFQNTGVQVSNQIKFRQDWLSSGGLWMSWREAGRCLGELLLDNLEGSPNHTLANTKVLSKATQTEQVVDIDNFFLFSFVRLHSRRGTHIIEAKVPCWEK